MDQKECQDSNNKKSAAGEIKKDYIFPDEFPFDIKSPLNQIQNEFHSCDQFLVV